MKDDALILNDLVASLRAEALASVWATSAGEAGKVMFKGDPRFGRAGMAINRCLEENGLEPAKLPSHAEYWTEHA